MGGKEDYTGGDIGILAECHGHICGGGGVGGVLRNHKIQCH